MGDTLLFLASNLFSGVMGHYVSKGLGNIDKKLPNLLKDETDIEKLKTFIADNNLEQDIIKFAREIEEIEMGTENTNKGNVVNFSGGTNTGVVANNVEIKTTTKKVNMLPPEGSIASVLSYRNYTKYLIDRYHEFKKADVKTKMNYAVLYNAVKREFGSKWDLVQSSKFNELSEYLQNRIDKTILGKNKKAKGIKRYSTYEEFCIKKGYESVS